MEYEKAGNLFNEGIRLRKNGELNDAIDIFSKIIKEYPDYPKLWGVCTLLADVYKKLGDFNSSNEYFKRGAQLNPTAEIASLGLYLSYIDLGRDEKAIQELDRYLSLHKADHYKVTLEELLEDLKNGYAGDFRDIVLKHARNNGFSV